MKIYHIIFVVVIVFRNEIDCACADTTKSNQSRNFTTEAVIHQLFELVRNLLRTGSSEHEIPVLDPYKLHRAEFSLKNAIFRIDTIITKAVCTGLGDFRVQRFNFSKTESALDFSMEWPLITFHSDYYELQGDLWHAVPLLGKGVMHFEVLNFVLRGKLYLKPSVGGQSILLDKMQTPYFSIDKIISQTEIDNNIEVIFNTMVEDLLADYLTRISKYLAATFSDDIIRYLNPTLEKFETWNIIASIL